MFCTSQTAERTTQRQHTRSGFIALLVPLLALTIAPSAGAERRNAEPVSAQDYRAARARGEAPAREARKPARRDGGARGSQARSDKPRTTGNRAGRPRADRPVARKGEPRTSPSQPRNAGRKSESRRTNDSSRKQAAVDRYERRLETGGRGRPHQTASGRSDATRRNTDTPRTATTNSRDTRPETRRTEGHRGKRTGASNGNADKAMAYAPKRTEKRDTRNRSGHRNKGQRSDHRRYDSAYRDGRRDGRRDARRHYKRRHFLDHWVPYSGWVAPRRIYRDTTWIGFATHHHQAHRHSYLSAYWLFAGELKTRTRHASDPVIYVDERVDAIELEGIKRDLHVRRAWMVLGNGRMVRLHDLEGYMEAGYSRAVFLATDRYVKRIELEVEPVGYSRGYARINVRRTDSGHIHDDYCEH